MKGITLHGTTLELRQESNIGTTALNEDKLALSNPASKACSAGKHDDSTSPRLNRLSELERRILDTDKGILQKTGDYIYYPDQRLTSSGNQQQTKSLERNLNCIGNNTRSSPEHPDRSFRVSHHTNQCTSKKDPKGDLGLQSPITSSGPKFYRKRRGHRHITIPSNQQPTSVKVAGLTVPKNIIAQAHLTASEKEDLRGTDMPMKCNHEADRSVQGSKIDSPDVKNYNKANKKFLSKLEQLDLCTQPITSSFPLKAEAKTSYSLYTEKEFDKTTLPTTTKYGFHSDSFTKWHELNEIDKRLKIGRAASNVANK